MKDSFIVNLNNNKPTGIKNLSSFLATVSSKKWSKLNVWIDGTWALTSKENSIKMEQEPLFSLNIDSFKESSTKSLSSLAEDIDADLRLMQKYKT